MNDIVIQGIGFLALICYIISYQIKSNKVLFGFQMAGCFLLCLQMVLLKAYPGAFSLLINGLRNLLMLKADKWTWARSRYMLYAVIAVMVVATLVTWNGWISIIPLISVIVTNVGYWTNNAQKIRISQLINNPMMLVYDALVKSWGGALTALFSFISIIVSIVRFGWKNLAEEGDKA